MPGEKQESGIKAFLYDYTPQGKALPVVNSKKPAQYIGMSQKSMQQTKQTLQPFREEVVPKMVRSSPLATAVTGGVLASTVAMFGPGILETLNII